MKDAAEKKLMNPPRTFSRGERSPSETTVQDMLHALQRCPVAIKCSDTEGMAAWELVNAWERRSAEYPCEHITPAALACAHAVVLARFDAMLDSGELQRTWPEAFPPKVDLPGKPV